MTKRTGHPRNTTEVCADGLTLAAHVMQVDANGDAISTAPGGTQYTEDAAAAANPVGTVPILVRADTPGALVTGDGDNVGQRGTNYGAAYVTLLDTSGAAVSVGGGTQYDRDVAAGAADKMTMAGGVRKDTPVSLVGADNDRTMAIYDANGRQHVIAPLPTGAATESTISALAGDLGDSADAEAAADGSLIAITKRLRTLLGAQPTHPVTIVDGGSVTLGAKADAKSTATDSTAITAMQVLKQISASVQAPPTQAITNADITSLLATAGATTGTKVITDANGTIQQYLRGLIYQSITAGAFLVTAALSAGTNLIGYVGGKNTFAAKVTLTTATNYKSLANGSGWSGGAITTSAAKAIRFRIQTKGQAGSANYVDFYLAASISGETTFDDAASATADQAFTAANRRNARYLGSVKLETTPTAVVGSLDSADIFTVLPGAVVLIAINNSGAALSTTAGDHVIDYELVN